MLGGAEPLGAARSRAHPQLQLLPVGEAQIAPQTFWADLRQSLLPPRPKIQGEKQGCLQPCSAPGLLPASPALPNLPAAVGTGLRADGRCRHLPGLCKLEVASASELLEAFV